MTLMTAPGPVTTLTGAALPLVALVALPQGELLTVNEKNIPLVRDAAEQNLGPVNYIGGGAAGYLKGHP